MKTILRPGILDLLTVALAGLNCFVATVPLRAQPAIPTTPSGSERPPMTMTSRLSTAVKPYPVLTAMQRVAGWQLAHADTNQPTDWVQAVGDVGIMALAGVSGDQGYRGAMLVRCYANGRELAEYPGRKYHADDQCEGQVWTELYFLYRENKMITPLRERFDFILTHPPEPKGLDFAQPGGKALEVWSWCDSLFMGPPTWLRLYSATGDERYLNFAVTNWWRTTDYLYDKNEHLFYRDSTYF